MAEQFDEFVILELFGRTKCAGRLRERVIAGFGYLWLEIPDGDGWVTRFISPNAAYAITPTTEELAREAAAQWLPQPVHRWELKPAKVGAVESGSGDSYDGEPPW